jgi:hypothetical protein
VNDNDLEDAIGEEEEKAGDDNGDGGGYMEEEKYMPRTRRKWRMVTT